MDQKSRDIDSILAGAIEIDDPKQQAAYLDRACGSDEQMRRRLEKLVAAHPEATGSFLQSPPPGLAETEASVNVQLGEQMGPYKLLQKLGEGGFGVVYLAEQKQPVQRRVALKIIKPGMDTGQVIARFEAERQALAMMDHPCIAKVFDAGATPIGRPFFVMELVKGVPITQYCDEQHFSPIQRLEMFVQVCQAVQHAHQKGIIHRDLKPQNILVAEYDQRPVAKIIDFGIAKATNQKLTEKTIFTQFGQIIGTLEYMSPEQAELSQLDIDTRSDVYSLGVILYELLTGVTPFEREKLRSAGYQEMLRIIREEDPPKPSTRISGWGTMTQKLSGSRRISVQKMRSLVHGDLDWIVMKSLEKDRARRYESASAFGDDIQRYLTDEPVVARPPSATYRFSKFARRNRSALAIAATLFLVLAVGGAVVGTALGQLQAEEEALDAVGGLANAVPGEVRLSIAKLPDSPQVFQQLTKLAGEVPTDVNDKRALHARLALVRDDAAHVPDLLEALLSENPNYIELITESLEPHKAAVEGKLWDGLHSNSTDSESVKRRFRSGAALAGLIPQSDPWTNADYRFLAEQLVFQENEDQSTYRNIFRPLLNNRNASEEFFRRWEELIDHNSTAVQLHVALAFRDFASNQHRTYADVLSKANHEQFGILLDKIKDSPHPELLAELTKISVELPGEELSSLDRVDFGKNRAGAAIALLRLKEHEAAIAAFKQTDDPEAMTQFIHGSEKRGVSAQQLIDCLDLASNTTAIEESARNSYRYALLLALSEQDVNSIPAEARTTLLKRLELWYEQDASSAVHGATGWLLRKWGQEEIVTRIDRTPKAYSSDREWFIVEIPLPPAEKTYMTFVVFQPGEYVLGAEPDELRHEQDESGTWKEENQGKLMAESMELRHKIAITRPFAILDRELTRAEVLAFDTSEQMDKLMRMFEADEPGDAAPGVNWYQSVRFCRWLTQRAGFSEEDQAFHAEELLDKERYPPDKNPAANGAPRDWPIRLEARGFRLPTEAEWEVACRSGMRTAFSHGGDEDLFGEYAWYGLNSNKDIHPPKLRKPNLRGLFDMHGNLFEFTFDWKDVYPTEVEADYVKAEQGRLRVLRGGCWGVSPYLSRASFRMAHEPSVGFIFMGLRPAMTLPTRRSEVPRAASVRTNEGTSVR